MSNITSKEGILANNYERAWVQPSLQSSTTIIASIFAELAANSWLFLYQLALTRTQVNYWIAKSSISKISKEPGVISPVALSP